MAGAWITLIGAALTIIVNYLFIPKYGYYASAWATFGAYGLMMVLSYLWGQKLYPIPYNLRKVLGYLVIAVAFFMIHKGVGMYMNSTWFNIGFGSILIILYLWFLAVIESAEMAGLPVVGKYFRKSTTAS